MKNVYKALVNLMAFYFIASLFAGVLKISGGSSFSNVFLPALVFGGLFAFLPSILKFLKLPDTTGALLLGGVVLNFFFYFVGFYLFKIFTITKGVVVFGIPGLRLEVNDQTLGFMVISLISAAISVILEVLSKKK